MPIEFRDLIGTCLLKSVPLVFELASLSRATLYFDHVPYVQFLPHSVFDNFTFLAQRILRSTCILTKM